MSKITKAVMYVEHEDNPGKAYLVVLPQDRMLILASLASSLDDSEKMRLLEMPNSSFTTLAETPL